MKIYIIIPGYNEEKYLENVLKNILCITENIIYIDDGSNDKSPTIAKKYLKYVLEHEVNLGKGAALKTGCEFAFKKLKADAVVFMDADGQHQAADLPAFLKELDRGVKIIFGVRKVSPQMPLVRFLGNKFASILLNFLFHAYIPDIPSGYKGFTKQIYNKIYWKSSGYEVETEIAAYVAKNKIPFKIVETETIYHDRDKGLTAVDALKIMAFIIKLRLGL